MQPKQLAGIILCGGRSSRMGRPKALLPFGTETLLERMVGILGSVCHEVVVVAAAGQALPTLPSIVKVAWDEQPEIGPLEGLRAGLNAVDSEPQCAYATGCDAPLLVPAFVLRMSELLGEHQAAAPVVDGRLQPLATVYRRDVVPAIEQCLRGPRRALVELLATLDTRSVLASELADVDPELRSLRNVNWPDDYTAALAELGLPPTLTANWPKHA